MALENMKYGARMTEPNTNSLKIQRKYAFLWVPRHKIREKIVIFENVPYYFKNPYGRKKQYEYLVCKKFVSQTGFEPMTFRV